MEMAGPFSPVSPMDAEAHAEMYIEMLSPLEEVHPRLFSRWERPTSDRRASSVSSLGELSEMVSPLAGPSTRWEFPVSAGSTLSESSLEDPFGDNFEHRSHTAPYERVSILWRGNSPPPLPPRPTKRFSIPPTPESPTWREIEQDLNLVREDFWALCEDDESPLVDHSHSALGVPEMRGEPFESDDLSVVMEEESLQRRARESSSRKEASAFFKGKGKQREALSVRRRGLELPMLQPSALSPLPTLASSPPSYFSSPGDYEIVSPCMCGQSPVLESPRLYMSPEYADFGNAAYTENLLYQASQQLTRLVEALVDSQEERDEQQEQYIEDMATLRQQIQHMQQRITVLEEQAKSKKSPHPRQRSIGFSIEDDESESQRQHIVYPKEHWPASRRIVTYLDADERPITTVEFENRTVQTAGERLPYPNEPHPRSLQSPAYLPSKTGTCATSASTDADLQTSPAMFANVASKIGGLALGAVVSVGLGVIAEKWL